MPELKRIIVVAGPHRSGTSAITKGLEVLGVSLGSRLVTPSAFNIKGYWEDMDFLGFNHEMLVSLGRDWHHLPPLAENEIASLLDTHFQRAVHLLQEKTRSSDLLGVKDPRFCILLPFWTRVFAECGVDAAYVIALRNPLSVALSLSVRDSMPREKAYSIWIGHLLGCLQFTKGCDRIIVDYNELLQKPAEQLSKQATALHLEVRKDRLQAYQDTFLDASLDHDPRKNEGLFDDPACPDIAKEIYQALHLIATDRAAFSGPDYEDALAKWLESFSAARSLLALSQKNDLAIDALLAAAAKQDRRIELLSGEKDQLLRGLEAQAAKERESIDLRQRMEERALERDRVIEGLQTANSEMQRALASVEAWQKSWFRRALSRWHRFKDASRPGFFRRLERSIHKRIR